MIQSFVDVTVENDTRGSVNKTLQTQDSLLLEYPCSNSTICTPYVLNLKPAVYKFECWGSKGGQKYSGTPGLGAYTSGILYVTKQTTFFVYIGNVGFFNAVKDFENITITAAPYPGGATDIRLNSSIDWWDNFSLISRIMVSAGGGSAEFTASIGGNGGTIEGDTSIYSNSKTYLCPGANQTSGSECSRISSSRQVVAGLSGSGGQTEGQTDGNDY